VRIFAGPGFKPGFKLCKSRLASRRPLSAARLSSKLAAPS